MGKKGGGNKPQQMSVNDMIKLAERESALSQDLLRSQTVANRPEQVTPWGTTIWENLGDDRWSQTVSLPEDQQRALDAQNALAAGRSELALGLLGRAEEDLGQPLDWQDLGVNPVSTASDARQSAEDALYGRATSRLDPFWEQRREQTETQLWNQGLRPGDEAYDTAMGNMERAEADAYEQARMGAIAGGGAEAQRDFGMDMQRRQQAIAELLRKRSSTLNEMSALSSGQQVGTPQMPSFSQQGAASAPNLQGAASEANRQAWERYNADEASKQSFWSGLTGVAGAALPFFFSDRRLKSDIMQVGHTPGGQPVYKYRIFGREEIGVMADESPPEAVVAHPNGFLMVDYSRIR